MNKYFIFIYTFFIINTSIAQVSEDLLLKVHNLNSTAMNNLNPDAGCLIYNTDDTNLYIFDGTAWLLVVIDDLGNHTATENIQTEGNWLSFDNTNKGVYVKSNGNIGINESNPIQKLDLKTGHILLNPDYGFGTEFSSTDKSVLFPKRFGMKSLGQLGPKSPYGDALTLETNTLIGCVETDAKSLVGYFDLKNKYFLWDGNVGISNTDPNRALVIKDNVIQVSSSGAHDNQADILFKEDGSISAQATQVFNIDVNNSSTNGYFYFQKNKEGLGTGLMKILENGRVGIGTNAPSSKLTVANGSINLESTSKYGGEFPVDHNSYMNVVSIGGIGGEKGMKIYKQNSGTGNNFLGLNNNYDCYVFEITDNNDNSPDGGIIFGATGKDDIFENIVTLKGSNARIGLGTNAPSQKLHVIGNILASGSITANSDLRLKKNIVALENALEKVTKVSGVHWNWKNTEKHGAKNNQIFSGLIAQDLEKVMPELVYTADDKMRIKSINYSGIFAYLIEAVKIQNKKIDLLVDNQNNTKLKLKEYLGK